MKRNASAWLDRWLDDTERRPLVLRGARQVGKTWLVRDLAARRGRELVELNFERDPRDADPFVSNDPRQILGELSLMLGRRIDPTRTLLFLDELQAAAPVLPKLRWFYEELPELPVIAAGSLLEFTLADHDMSMPVGRVSFLHLEPMGFDEYLRARGEDLLLDALASWRPGEALSAAAHERATVWFARYAMVGGMPAVVAADATGRSPGHVRALQSDLMATYRADFAKYSGRMDPATLDATLVHVARSLGQRFVYTRVADAIRGDQARAALERLAHARLCHVIPHTAANGLPLAAEVKDRLRKAILADAGLLHALLGTPAGDAFPHPRDLSPQLRGQLAEQLVAQQLRLAVAPGGEVPQLYYWQRTGGRTGEVDFVLQLHGRVVPVEVKAGPAGAMKSLHQFMHDKRLARAVRCDANPPDQMRVDVLTTQRQRVAYTLVTVPPYLAWNLDAILES